MAIAMGIRYSFNTQPPEGGCICHNRPGIGRAVSTHSRLKAAGALKQHGREIDGVSTRSRLKAAGPTYLLESPMAEGFNTQPPEGGWTLPAHLPQAYFLFQHAAA